MDKFPMCRRIEELFDTFHLIDETEKSNAAVVEYLVGRGHDITVEEFDRFRSGASTSGMSFPAVASDIAGFFRFPGDYLTASEDDQRFKELQEQLDTLRVFRQQGVKRLRFRGQPTSSDRAALIRALRG
ncbi:hypothetical protein HQO83_07185 [Rhodococcus fascians]|nr:hypothetical protein [Rhodococcus fascians]